MASSASGTDYGAPTDGTIAPTSPVVALGRIAGCAFMRALCSALKSTRSASRIRGGELNTCCPRCASTVTMAQALSAICELVGAHTATSLMYG
jgi:hypothetical protein